LYILLKDFYVIYRIQFFEGNVSQMEKGREGLILWVKTVVRNSLDMPKS